MTLTLSPSFLSLLKEKDLLTRLTSKSFDCSAELGFSEENISVKVLHNLLANSVAHNWPWDKPSLARPILAHCKELFHQAADNKIHKVIFDLGLFRIKGINSKEYPEALATARQILSLSEDSNTQLFLPLRWPAENPKSSQLAVTREVASDCMNKRLKICAEICTDELTTPDALDGLLKQTFFQVAMVRFHSQAKDLISVDHYTKWQESLKEQGFDGLFVHEIHGINEDNLDEILQHFSLLTPVEEELFKV